ncbi:RCC1 Chromatin-associated guanine nucleotide exchange factor for Ran [Aspergillus mulundensis]|uniref:RCC1 Chromatin-associated guanine nucleotide exchange factor for Ran n=1 Tax=Aspergillus mulundensis TaxID=1810919 RepID=A0A3D8QZ40_9EURO|nr:RCC1 Chromatin-associated guanine nucleotide exchange factor for Ran [Aspergillus mulundensis]RDW67093.1 RCC1 Chromatin-associated guanine nucleotide exchange factor for Ran [Aspergillus mulundensis]
MPPKKSATKTAARTASVTQKKTTVAANTTKKATATKIAARERAAITATTKNRATKTATKPAAARKAAKAEDITKKRALTDDEDDDLTSRSTKRARVAKPATAKRKPKVVINSAPTVKLNVYVCGEGSSGELGLGVGKNVIDVKRPRLNPHLLPDSVGVVQVAVGGMHCVALTHDNKILTWGVNDQGALGRDTTWEGGYKDMDKGGSGSDSDDDSDDDPELNPHECTPTAIPSGAFPQGTVFVEVAAGDSSSFALTDEGEVYGWGTFRSNDGILGFDASSKVQMVPKLLLGLKKVKHLVCGDNHVLALNEKGAVLSWGSGQQNQLGRRIIERNKLNGLQPREFGHLKNIVHIGAGAFHSFAVDQNGKVYAWGLNSFGETGIRENAGDSEAAIVRPEVVKSLSKMNIAQICGGAHHSIAATQDGQCLVWGRLDGYQTGLKIDSLPDDAVIKDERGRPRILIQPTAVPGIKAKAVAAGSDHSIAIGTDGRPWSWGFSATYQTGQGTQDDVEVATIVENTAVRGKALNWAGGGGQFSVFTEPI